jgi:hypothetical protein
MAAKRDKADVPEQRPLDIAKISASETDGRAMARTALRPAVNNAVTLSKVLARGVWESPSLPDLVQELAQQCSVVSDGKTDRPEALLTAQAHTLDALFNDLTRLAYRNWDNLIVADRLLRLAFKAQTQGRATVETLGNLRNPPMVIARQANIAHGPQQVNNGELTRTRDFQSEPSKLLEAQQPHPDNLLLRNRESRDELAVSSDRDELAGTDEPHF